MQLDKNRGIFILLTSFVIVFTGVVMFVEPIGQWPEYHNFADTRTIWDIPNFANVASNLGYAIVGIWGVYSIIIGSLSSRFEGANEKWLFVVFFAAVAVVSLGSGYYHFKPDNNGLFWDRLPMTVAFMALFALVVGDHLNRKLGRMLAWVLIPAGIFSLVYWLWTQTLGHGDLRFYALVQFFPIIAIPLICYFYRQCLYTPLKPILWVIAWYGVGKLLEVLDAEVFAGLGNIISGHSLKHIASAIAVGVVLRMLYLTRTRF